MKGIITRRDLLRHPFMVVKHFGISLFIKALFSKNKPFLDFIQNPASKVPMALKPYTSTMDVFSYYERRIAAIFLTFAERFSELKSAERFYRELAKQKMGHYAILQFVKSFAPRRKIHNEKWQPYLNRIDDIEFLIRRSEESLERPLSLRDALQITEELSSSGINKIYQDLKDSIYSNRVVAASNLLLSEQYFDKLCQKEIPQLQRYSEDLAKTAR